MAQTLVPTSFRERSDSGIRIPVGSAPQLQPVLQYCLIRMASHTAEYVARCWPTRMNLLMHLSDFGRGDNPTIDSNYVDGVSLTHGSNPRQHIWTFAAALDEFTNTFRGKSVRSLLPPTI